MAVEVEVYGVDAGMVVDRLPIDSANITPSTRPLSTDNINAFISDGAAQITALLESHGIGTSLTDDNMRAQVQAAIVHFAVWKSLEKLPNMPQIRIDAAERAWLDDVTRYSSRVEMLVTQPADKTETNVSTASNKRASEFVGLDYEF